MASLLTLTAIKHVDCSLADPKPSPTISSNWDRYPGEPLYLSDQSQDFTDPSDTNISTLYLRTCHQYDGISNIKP